MKKITLEFTDIQHKAFKSYLETVSAYTGLMQIALKEAQKQDSGDIPKCPSCEQQVDDTLLHCEHCGNNFSR